MNSPVQLRRISDVFPDAPDRDERFQPIFIPTSIKSASLRRAMSLALIWIGAFAALTGAIAVFVTDPNIGNQQPGQGPVPDAFAWPEMTWTIGLLVWTSGVVSFRLARRSYRVQSSERASISPEQWATLRGFQVSHQPRATVLAEHVGEHGVTAVSTGIGPVMRGFLGRHEVLVGGFSTVSPFGSAGRSGAALCVIARLPENVVLRRSGSLVSQDLLTDFSMQDPLGVLRLLELESERVENRYSIGVSADDDLIDWIDFFDPELLDAIATRWPVSWIQAGTLLCVFAPLSTAGWRAILGAPWIIRPIADNVCDGALAILNAFHEPDQASGHSQSLRPENRSMRPPSRWVSTGNQVGIAGLISFIMLLVTVGVGSAMLIGTMDAPGTQPRADTSTRDESDAQIAAAYLARAEGACITSGACSSDPDPGALGNLAGTLTTDGVKSSIVMSDRIVDSTGPRRSVTVTSRGGIRYEAIARIGADGQVKLTFRCTPPDDTYCPDGTWSDPAG